MKKITKNQLRLLIIAHVTAGTGFSVNIYGKAPSTGYMSGFNEGVLVKTGITQHDVDQWVDRNYRILLHNPHLYAGGWQDGAYYLELAKNIQDPHVALNFADRYDQKAIWDVVNEMSICLDRVSLPSLPLGLTPAQEREQARNIAKWQRGMDQPQYRFKN